MKTLQDLRNHFKLCNKHESGWYVPIRLYKEIEKRTPLQDTMNPFAFLYCIHDENNDKFYIGSKQFFFVSTRLNAKKVNQHPTESDWRTYYGSSTPMKAAMEQYGKKKFKRYMLSTWRNQISLKYEEVRLQWALDVITDVKPNGDFRFYNLCIDKVFRKQEHIDDLLVNTTYFEDKDYE